MKASNIHIYRWMQRIVKFNALVIVLLLVLLPLAVLTLTFFTTPPKTYAYSNPTTVPLLTVQNFTALAKSTITNAVAGTVLNNGDMGLDSPATCTGFPSPCTGVTTNGTINGGVIQYQNAVALQGQTDATAAVTNIGLRSADQTFTAQLGGQTLNQGVYQVGAAATNLTGDLTLNGDANSVFIFHLTSTLITDTGSRVLLTGGAQACNVFWKVDSSATFNGNTTMVGTVLASASITFPGGGATLDGRAIAQTAAITFNNTTVNNSSCAISPSPSPGKSPSPSVSPEVSPSPSPSQSPSPSPTPSSTPSISPSPNSSPTPTPSQSPSPSVSPSPESTPSASSSPSNTNSSPPSSGGSSPSSNSNSSGQVLGASTLAQTGQSFQLIQSIIGLGIMSLGLWHLKRSLGPISK